MFDIPAVIQSKVMGQSHRLLSVEFNLSQHQAFDCWIQHEPVSPETPPSSPSSVYTEYRGSWSPDTITSGDSMGASWSMADQQVYLSGQPQPRIFQVCFAAWTKPTNWETLALAKLESSRVVVLVSPTPLPLHLACQYFSVYNITVGSLNSIWLSRVCWMSLGEQAQQSGGGLCHFWSGGGTLKCYMVNQRNHWMCLFYVHQGEKCF